ncbi:transposase [Streptomyces sparsogenes]
MQSSRPYPSDLSDARWELIRPTLEARRQARAGIRKSTHDLRALMDAILYVDRTGTPWRYLPHNFPPHQTVYGYFAKWEADGIFDQLTGEVRRRHPTATKAWADDGYKTKAVEQAAQIGIDLEIVQRNPTVRGFRVQPRRWVIERTLGWLMNHRRLARDREAHHQDREERGKAPLGGLPVPGARGSRDRRGGRRPAAAAQAVLGKVQVPLPVGRPRARPAAVADDKAYSSRANRANRAHLRKRRIKAVIPEKKDQAANRRKKGSRGGRPVTHSADLYHDRNTVERAINRMKDWRGIATRYGKTPDSHLAGLHLRAATIWISSLLETQ